MNIIYLDGKYVKIKPSLLETLAPGKVRAKGVFETMLGVDGVVMDMQLHLKRLRQGLKTFDIKAPRIDPAILTELLKRNQLVLARVRLMVWGSEKLVHIMIAALPYKMPTKEIYRVCLVKTDWPANNKGAHVKSLDYHLFLASYAYAQAQGFDEALLINKKGYIFEASRANIFWIKKGVLYTPPLSSGCLQGITRGQVIQKARGLGIPLKEKNLSPKDLKNADTAFLTNSLVGIKPITL